MSSKFIQNYVVNEKLAVAEALLKKVIESQTFEEKWEIVSSNPIIEGFLENSNVLKAFMSESELKIKYVIGVILAIGQGLIVFTQLDKIESPFEALQGLIRDLLEVEKDYAFMGGVVGYYHAVLSLIIQKKCEEKRPPLSSVFYSPPGIHLDHPSEKNLRSHAIHDGLRSLPQMAHIYPIGGAGERLDLRDEQTGLPLPVAYLSIAGFSLLEGMVRDLQATEYLYWKLYEKQIVTPIAMMTSVEKNNSVHIEAICKKSAYFGRSKDSFRQFIQPLVPVITEKGDFSLSAPLQLVLKPGGHGVLWKLAQEQGIFDWFESMQKSKMLIRQINNPVANTDGGTIPFTGIGCTQQKVFGFLSCDRLLNAAEGMLVLSETKMHQKFRYCMTNIEYTDFNCRGIQDLPVETGGIYSAFPANTNILFADIGSIRALSQKDPLPGMLINMKTKVPFLNEEGSLTEVFGGRLESMMQNIADSIVDEFPTKFLDEKQTPLSCYIAYENRRRVISVTKKKYIEGNSVLETPEGCFYDIQLNSGDLLVMHAHMQLPKLGSLEDFIQKGPPFLVRYHPALGPLYEVIGQKIRRGILEEGAELILEIAELDIEDLVLEGSLSIIAKDPLGHRSADGYICYSNNSGKCELKNVQVINLGINQEVKNIYWKNKIARKAQLEIILHGNGEFMAENVIFEGNQKIEVPSGTRLEATMQNGTIHYQSRPISGPSWYWFYSFNSDKSILLQKRS